MSGTPITKGKKKTSVALYERILLSKGGEGGAAGHLRGSPILQTTLRGGRESSFEKEGGGFGRPLSVFHRKKGSGRA